MRYRNEEREHMNKLEFIDRLRAALTGRLSAEEVQEHVNYYEDYINTQIRLGTGEEEVLRSLGEPRLIAKTIVETSNIEENENTANRNQGYYHSAVRTQNSGYLKLNKLFNIPGWLWAIILVLIVVLVLGLVFTVLSAFAPLICMMLIVVGAVKFFERLH